jgi:hypothetical protein
VRSEFIQKLLWEWEWDLGYDRKDGPAVESEEGRRESESGHEQDGKIPGRKKVEEDARASRWEYLDTGP